MDSQEHASQHRLRLLLLSDVHFCLDKIEALRRRLQSGGNGCRSSYDFLIVSGDLVNVRQEVGATEKDYAEIRAVLDSLCELTAGGETLFWIPGNHDPEAVFRALPGYCTVHAELPGFNFHKKVVQLAPGLQLAGLGGSVDNGLKSDPSKVVWKGYPYTEETLGADLTKVLRASPENTSRLPASSGSPQTLLLVTHVGPSECGTTDVNNPPDAPDGKRVEGGSAALRRVLSSNEFQSPQRQRNVIANIHGHTHHPWGNTALGRIRIINPGALCDGRFAFVNLVRDGVVDGEVEDSAVRPDGTVQRQAGSAEADTANVSRNCLSEPESADKLYWRIERIEHYTHC